MEKINKFKTAKEISQLQVKHYSKKEIEFELFQLLLLLGDKELKTELNATKFKIGWKK